MTTATPSTPTPRTAAAAMLRGGLVAGVGVGLVCVGVAYAFVGADGAAGAATGSALVALFFALSFWVLDRTRRLPAEAMMLIALALYAAKVVGLLVVLMVLSGLGALDGPLHRPSLALSIVAATVTWTVVEMSVVARHRQPMYEPVETPSRGL